MYLDEVELLTKRALDVYPEPSLRCKGQKDYKKRWYEHYIIAQTLLKCYDRLDTDPIDIFDNEILQYSIAKAASVSNEKKKLYTIYVNALSSISLLQT